MENATITDERLAEVLTEAYGSPEWTMADVRAARAVEAASLALRPAAQPVGWKTEALRLFDLYAANLLNNANAQATSTRDSFRALLSVPPAAQPVGGGEANIAAQFGDVLDAWRKGAQVQYFVLAGYDSEWSDYGAVTEPQEQSGRLSWRIKPATK